MISSGFQFLHLTVFSKEIGIDPYLIINSDLCSDSNVAAGKLFGIPLRGTHSHAFVSSFMVCEIFLFFAIILPKDGTFAIYLQCNMILRRAN